MTATFKEIFNAGNLVYRLEKNTTDQDAVDFVINNPATTPPSYEDFCRQLQEPLKIHMEASYDGSEYQMADADENEEQIQRDQIMTEIFENDGIHVISEIISGIIHDVEYEEAGEKVLEVGIKDRF